MRHFAITIFLRLLPYDLFIQDLWSAYMGKFKVSKTYSQKQGKKFKNVRSQIQRELQQLFGLINSISQRLSTQGTFLQHRALLDFSEINLFSNLQIMNWPPRVNHFFIPARLSQYIQKQPAL